MDWSILRSFHANSFPGRARDATGLAELLATNKLFCDWGDQWVGIETVLSEMHPGESRQVTIPFENFGVEATRRILNSELATTVQQAMVRDALFFADKDKFIYRLSKALGTQFTQPMSAKLESLFNATRLAEETFRAVYRLLILGLLDDYEIEYGRHRIQATLVRLHDETIITNLTSYLARYIGRHDPRISPHAIIARKGATTLQKCCGHLLDFVYAEIAAKRHRAMENMQSAVHGGLEYGINEFARRVNTYFDSRFTVSLVNDLKDKPPETIVENYIDQAKARPDDIQHLWALAIVSLKRIRRTVACSFSGPMPAGHQDAASPRPPRTPMTVTALSPNPKRGRKNPL